MHYNKKLAKLIDQLVPYLSTKNLIVVEGYEMTGKSTLIQELTKLLIDRLPGTIIAKQDANLNHDLVSNSELEYNDLYLVGCINARSVCSLQPSTILRFMISDRALRSSLHYAKITGNLETHDQIVTSSLVQDTYDQFDTIIVINMRLGNPKKNLMKYRSNDDLQPFDPTDQVEYIKNYNRFENDNHSRWIAQGIYSNKARYVEVNLINKVNKLIIDSIEER